MQTRNIEISNYARIGNRVKIGNNTKIGYNTEIGDYARIGKRAKIGDFAKIGYNTEIGDYVEIGNSTKIGDFAKIGYNTEIGDYVEIGNSAKIGDFAKIDKDNILSESSIFYHLGLVVEKEKVTMYKTVKEDLTDFYSGKYQYKTNNGDSNKSLTTNQSLQCGPGWHFTNLQGAVEFGKQTDQKYVIISAVINIKDILHISYKARVRAFKNVKIVKIKGLTC